MSVTTTSLILAMQTLADEEKHKHLLCVIAIPVAIIFFLLFPLAFLFVGFNDNSYNVDFVGQYPMPCDSTIVSSDYGQRVHPITKESTKHTGIDLVPEWHSDIYAIADGYVVATNYDDSFGNSITLSHSDQQGNIIFYSFYAHLSAVYVNVGDKICEKNIIGREGGDPDFDDFPGMSIGHHLHFEIRLTSEFGTDINPKLFLDGK